MHAARIDGRWSTAVVGAEGETGWEPAIALDDAGAAHVVYRHETSYDLRHATNGDGTWFVETIDSAGAVGLDPSIALDQDGALRVSSDATNGDLRYVTNTDGRWATEIVDAEGDTGTSCSIGIDSEGGVHTSYQDWGAKLLRYAFRAAPDEIDHDCDGSPSVPLRGRRIVRTDIRAGMR